MQTRQPLPQRRHSETFTFNWGQGAVPFAYVVTCGYYNSGQLGEVFITGGKSGVELEAIARDGAVLMSIALQYGATLDTIAHAITRDQRGVPSSIVGGVVDELIKIAAKDKACEGK